MGRVLSQLGHHLGGTLILLMVLLLTACSQPEDDLVGAAAGNSSIEVPEFGSINNPFGPISCEEDPNQAKCQPSCQPGDTSRLCQIEFCEANAQQNICAALCADTSVDRSDLTFCGDVCTGGTVEHSYCDLVCTVDNAPNEEDCLVQCEGIDPPGFCGQLCAGNNAGDFDFCSGGEVCTINHAQDECTSQCTGTNQPSFCEGLADKCEVADPPVICDQICAGENADNFGFCAGGNVCTPANAEGNNSCLQQCVSEYENNNDPLSDYCTVYCTDGSAPDEVDDFCASYCPDPASTSAPSYCYTADYCQGIFDGNSNGSLTLPDQCASYCPEESQGGLPGFCVGYYCEVDDGNHSYCPTLECTLENALDNPAECQQQCSNSGTNLPGFCELFCPTTEGDFPNFCQAYCPIEGSAGSTYCQSICSQDFGDGNTMQNFCGDYCPEDAAAGSVPGFCKAYCPTEDSSDAPPYCLTFCPLVDNDGDVVNYCLAQCTGTGQPQYCDDIIALCEQADPDNYCIEICAGDYADNFDFCSGGEVCTINHAPDECTSQCTGPNQPGFCEGLADKCEVADPPAICNQICAGENDDNFNFCAGGEVCTPENAEGNNSCLQQCVSEYDNNNDPLSDHCSVYCTDGSAPNAVDDFCASYCPDPASTSAPSYCYTADYCQGIFDGNSNGSLTLPNQCASYCPEDSTSVPGYCAAYYCPVDSSADYCKAACEAVSDGVYPGFCATICTNHYDDGQTLPNYCQEFCPTDNSSDVPPYCVAFCPLFDNDGNIVNFCLAQCTGTGQPGYCDDINTQCEQADPADYCDAICSGDYADNFDFCAGGEVCTIESPLGDGCVASCALNPNQTFCPEICKDDFNYGFCQTICDATQNADSVYGFCKQFCDPNEDGEWERCDRLCSEGEDEGVDYSYCEETCKVSAYGGYCDAFCTDDIVDKPSFCGSCEQNPNQFTCVELCENPDNQGDQYCSDICSFENNNGEFGHEYFEFCDQICENSGDPKPDFCGDIQSCEQNSHQPKCSTCEFNITLENLAECVDNCRADYKLSYCDDICEQNEGYGFCVSICAIDNNYLFCGKIQSCDVKADQEKCKLACISDNTPNYCAELCNLYPDLLFCLGDDPARFRIVASWPKLYQFQWVPIEGKSFDHYKIATSQGAAWQSEAIANTARSYLLSVPLYIPAWSNAAFVLRGCDSDGQCEDIGQATYSDPVGQNRLGLTGYLKSPAQGFEWNLINQGYGRSVALSDDGQVMAIGADSWPKNPLVFGFGVVHLLYRNADTGAWAWSGTPLQMTNIKEDDAFGAAISLSADGNVLAVGVPGREVTVGSTTYNDAGVVLVYRRLNGNWQAPAVLVSPSPVGNGRFGTSVVFNRDGNVLAIGAVGEKGGVGQAYVFQQTNDQWSNPSITAFNNDQLGLEAGARFGASLALYYDNDVGFKRLVVGAPSAKRSDENKAGLVYIFNKATNTTVWLTQQQQWVRLQGTGIISPANSASGSQYGTSLSLSDDGLTLAVGSKFDARRYPTSSDDFNPGGAAYVWSLPYGSGDCNPFRPCTETWLDVDDPKATVTLIKPGGRIDVAQQFGAQVSLSADAQYMAVAAPREPGNRSGVMAAPSASGPTIQGAGAVYMYRRSGSDWQLMSFVKAANPGKDDYFGTSLSLSADGKTLAVGAPAEDRGSWEVMNSGVKSKDNEDDDLPESGAVYLY